MWREASRTLCASSPSRLSVSGGRGLLVSRSGSGVVSSSAKGLCKTRNSWALPSSKSQLQPSGRWGRLIIVVVTGNRMTIASHSGVRMVTLQWRLSPPFVFCASTPRYAPERRLAGIYDQSVCASYFCCQRAGQSAAAQGREFGRGGRVAPSDRSERGSGCCCMPACSIFSSHAHLEFTCS
jgi:hypothetical protein